jgi:hypothetical protein
LVSFYNRALEMCRLVLLLRHLPFHSVDLVKS